MSNKESKPTLYCSFCGKSQHNVKKLIAGPKVLICDECVVLCMEIITEEESKTGSSYGKFLAFHKKRPTSLEKFNTFFGTKSPAEKTEETTEKIVKKLDEIHNRLTGIVNKLENQ